MNEERMAYDALYGSSELREKRMRELMGNDAVTTEQFIHQAHMVSFEMGYRQALDDAKRLGIITTNHA